MRLACICAAALTVGSVAAGEQLKNLPSCAKGVRRLTVPTESVWPAAPGEAYVCLWHEDKTAAFSITIDDNCKPDHAWWLKLTEELGFKVTWFVITDKVGAANAGFDGTWDDWQRLVDAGHSVQSHTTNHASSKSKGAELTDDELDAMYGDSLKALNANLRNNRACCIAYPRGEAHTAIVAKHAIAARGTTGVPDTADRIDYLCTNAGGGLATAEMLVNGTTDKGPKWLPAKKHLKRGWAVSLYHLVHHGRTPEAQAEAAAKVEAEIRAIAALKDRLWIGRFDDVARYGQERDTATLTTVANGADRIVLDLADRMDDRLFDFPLSVKVRLPDGWTSVKAKQGGSSVSARLVEHDGHPYALVSAVPDRGQIVLAK